jgi:hypothetical protein
MSAKEPALLTVLIDVARLQWHVGSISLEGSAIPLIRSEPGNLEPCLGVPLDEQVGFLRHRFAGVLQRGCDRMWGRQLKPRQIVFVADGPFPDGGPVLTRRVAEHFVDWMVSPPVVYFERQGAFSAPEITPLQSIAGDFDELLLPALTVGLASLYAATNNNDDWEIVPSKPRSHQG